ncbi:hypothetical protein D3C80_969610 [compost metagenome]
MKWQGPLRGEPEQGQPLVGQRQLAIAGAAVEADGVIKPRQDHRQHRAIDSVVEVQRRADQTDVTLDLPDALAAATAYPEQHEIVAVALRMIAGDEGEQGRLAGTVRANQLPVLPLPNGPVEPVDHPLLAIGDPQVAHLHPGAGGQGGGRRERRRQPRTLPLDPRQLGHLRAPQHIVALPRQQQTQLPEQAEVAGEGGDLVESIDDDHQAQPLCHQISQQRHQLEARALIQAIERLVQHQQLGPRQQGAGQQQLASLTAREITVGTIPQPRYAKARQQRPCLRRLPHLQHQGRYLIPRLLFFPQHVGVAPLPVLLPQLLLRLEGEAHGIQLAQGLPRAQAQLAA